MSTRLRSSWEATTLLSCTTRTRTHRWQHPSSWTWSLLAELCERIEVKRGEGGKEGRREGGREEGKKEGREGGREERRKGGREGEGGRKGGRKEGRKEGREGGREGGKKGGREGGREGGKKGGREGGDWQLQNDRRYGDQGRVIIINFLE